MISVSRLILGSDLTLVSNLVLGSDLISVSNLFWKGDSQLNSTLAVADLGFPIGGVDQLGVCGPLMQALVSKNVCENKRIGSCRGHAPGTPPPRSANV